MEHIPFLGEESGSPFIGITDGLGFALRAQRAIEARINEGIDAESKSVSSEVRPHSILQPGVAAMIDQDGPINVKLTGVQHGPLFPNARARKIEGLKRAIYGNRAA